ncbi:hypothetical protein F511_24703 [Dorcoceras hygrometricum]|uniref:Uncharacterized protein n=1 Tax=Dorcoceras hygrometricum TaxID=472368 RepID=A0A2Z7BRA7_9LAMI|nr:hypothetical protein F511_24703 [Dorcoceras hygrometricum]
MAGAPPAGPPSGPIGSNGTNHGPNRGSQCTRKGQEEGCSPCATYRVISTFNHEKVDLRVTDVVDAISGNHRLLITKITKGWRDFETCAMGNGGGRLKPLDDQSGLGFSFGESSSEETSTQSNLAIDKFNKMNFVKVSVTHDVCESIKYNDQFTGQLNNKGKNGELKALMADARIPSSPPINTDCNLRTLHTASKLSKINHKLSRQSTSENSGRFVSQNSVQATIQQVRDLGRPDFRLRPVH